MNPPPPPPSREFYLDPLPEVCKKCARILGHHAYCSECVKKMDPVAERMLLCGLPESELDCLEESLEEEMNVHLNLNCTPQIDLELKLKNAKEARFKFYNQLHNRQEYYLNVLIPLLEAEVEYRKK